MTVLALIALVCAAGPAVLYARNVRHYCPPPPDPAASPPRVSVLIPARNEERSIRAAVEAILASTGVELECVVLDDQSDDRTAAIVRELAATDGRVRLVTATPLPAGWSGKQHACSVLAGLARHRILAFLDADVRLAPDGLARMAAFLRRSKAALVSGFPRQETRTPLELLVIPLVHFLLLGFLPLWRMRRSARPGFGAGCGQLFMTTREAYKAVGGHAAVRDSFHDGIKLPRAYRAAGLMTDLCDATDLATCRMYRNGWEVWQGLAKNAREGLGAPRLIVFATLLLLCGQVLPFVLMPAAVAAGSWEGAIVALAVACAWLPRFDAARRFRQPLIGAVLHPVGVLVLLAIQWYATARTVVGRPVGWKGRVQPVAVAR